MHAVWPFPNFTLQTLPLMHFLICFFIWGYLIFCILWLFRISGVFEGCVSRVSESTSDSCRHIMSTKQSCRWTIHCFLDHVLLPASIWLFSKWKCVFLEYIYLSSLNLFLWIIVKSYFLYRFCKLYVVLFVENETMVSMIWIFYIHVHLYRVEKYCLLFVFKAWIF